MSRGFFLHTEWQEGEKGCVCSKDGDSGTHSHPEARLQRRYLKFTFSCYQVWRQPALLASLLSGQSLGAVTYKTKFLSHL